MKPTIGRTVHIVLPNGQHRSAVVCRDWGNNCINVRVAYDGTNDDDTRNQATNGGYFFGDDWLTSINLDESVSPCPRTWHWPERED